MQVNYEENIQNSIKSLLESYENAPTDTIKKYDLLFSCILDRNKRNPITHPIFTYYPSTGRIISSCEKRVVQLTALQNEIFYLLSKNLNTGNMINQDVLYNFIYQNNHASYSRLGHHKPHPDTIKVHIYKLNIKINPFKIMIRHNLIGGWSIRTERDEIMSLNEIKNNFPRGLPFK